MVHGRVVRRVHQGGLAAPDLPQNLWYRGVRFQFVTVTLLEFGEAVGAVVEVLPPFAGG